MIKDKGAIKFTICLLLVAGLLSVLTLASSAQTTMSQEQFYKAIKSKGINKDKPAVDFTDEELSIIAELLSKRFEDIKGDEWFIKDLALLSAKGIINGYGSEGKIFAGSAVTTRAEYWAMQGRLQGINGTINDNVKKEISDMIWGTQFGDSFVYEWYVPYYFYQKGIPFGVYSNIDMKKPVYRGEVASLIFEYLARSESTSREISDMADKNYFTDMPVKVISIFDSDENSALHKDLEKNLGFKVAYYFVPFYKVVNKEHNMLETTKVAINWCNKVGIMCGFSDGTSGWDKELTRAEAVATLARAFRTENRLPVEKRKK